MTSVTPILEVDHLIKDFDGFRAVDDVSLSLRPGEIRAVIGPNGAGKSTLFSLIIGEQRPTAGTIRLAGQDVTGMPTHRIMKKGMGCAFQATTLFWRLTVRECLEVAVSSIHGHSSRMFGAFGRAVGEEADVLVEMVGLTSLAGVLARELSHGDQRALEVAMALAMRPKVLLLDEPTAGMSPGETARAVELVRDLARSKEITVVLVEHDVSVVFSVSDIVTVMHEGHIIAEGPPEAIRTDAAVVEVYLGSANYSKGLQ